MSSIPSSPVAGQSFQGAPLDVPVSNSIVTVSCDSPDSLSVSEWSLVEGSPVYDSINLTPYGRVLERISVERLQRLYTEMEALEPTLTEPLLRSLEQKQIIDFMPFFATIEQQQKELGQGLIILTEEEQKTVGAGWAPRLIPITKEFAHRIRSIFNSLRQQDKGLKLLPHYPQLVIYLPPKSQRGEHTQPLNMLRDSGPYTPTCVSSADNSNVASEASSNAATPLFAAISAATRQILAQPPLGAAIPPLSLPVSAAAPAVQPTASSIFQPQSVVPNNPAPQPSLLASRTVIQQPSHQPPAASSDSDCTFTDWVAAIINWVFKDKKYD